jgi:hypothetical protein
VDWFARISQNLAVLIFRAKYLAKYIVAISILPHLEVAG